MYCALAFLCPLNRARNTAVVLRNPSLSLLGVSCLKTYSHVTHAMYYIVHVHVHNVSGVLAAANTKCSAQRLKMGRAYYTKAEQQGPRMYNHVHVQKAMAGLH